MSKGYRVTIREGWNGPEMLLNSDVYQRIRLVSATVSKSVSAYDSFTFTLDPSHKLYAIIKPYKFFVKVTRPDKNKVLFEGRVLTYSDSMDSSGVIQKTAVCEGLEGFLHDSVQPWKEFHNTTPKDFLQALINEHNKQVEDFKQMRLGNVTVTNSTDNVYRFADDTKDTYDNIQDKLVSRLGGELRVRNENGTLYLDYMPKIGGTATQKIKLAKNLLSSSRNIDPTEVITVLKPLGATQERQNNQEDQTEASSPRLTIASANGGNEYLRDEELIKEFGIRARVQTWDDVTTADALLQKGRAYLASQKAIKYEIQLTYVDLSYIKDNVAMFDCGDTVTVQNMLQGLEIEERIVSMSIDLLQVQNTTMTLSNDPMAINAYRKQLLQAYNADMNAFYNLLKDQKLNTADLEKALKSSNSQIKSLQQALQELENKFNGQTPQPQPMHIGKIIDVSEWQGVIDWPQVIADDVSLSIIRVQDGSTHQDLKYMENIQKCISAGGKYAVYAYFRGASTADAQQEARDFYNRTQRVVAGKQQPVFYALDIESVEMGGAASQMRAGVEAYMNQLNTLGIPDNKIVLYIANHLYASFNLNVARAGAIWIPSYGRNDGTVANSLRPTHPYDLWQYSSKGSINGITGNVDLSTEASDKFKKLLQ
ncbi:phage tail spike protein [Ligilactobacillus agilis]|uniref:phage tail spike protein n=1 Tax=Ligilactobacillus agilis TaxID=1601 RepID=UPI00155885FA|nr:phage tail spike protein [Ligilactobacillus agilis]